MREEEGVMPALNGEKGQGLFGARPERLYVGLEPAAELESVKLSLVEQQSQHLFTVHFTNPLIERTKVSGESFHQAAAKERRKQSFQASSVCE
jgi:hypothetical protein